MRLVSQEEADAVWENAVVSKTGDGRYLVSNPKGSFLWAEVITLKGGGLLVHGDCETVLFGIHSSNPLRTIGENPTNGYIRGKADIGTGKRFLVYDHETARKELEEFRQEWVEHKVYDGLGIEKAKQTVDDIIDEFLTSSDDFQAFAVHTLIQEFPDWSEPLLSLGLVTDPHLYYSHAAVRKVFSSLPDGVTS